MTVDLNALRKKHEELLNKGKKNSGNTEFLENFVQLEEGTTVLRILPSKTEDSLFYAETKIHRVPNNNGGTDNKHCLKVHNEKCPICDKYYGLWKTKNKDDEKLARSIKPTPRYYLNVLERNTGKVKILSVGSTLFEKIISTMLNEDYGDVTDLQKGFDFKIHKKIVKETNGTWPKYDQSEFRPKASPAGTPQEIAAMMETLHDIHSLVKKEDYGEMKLIAESLSSDMPSEDEKEPQAQTKPATEEEFRNQLKNKS